MVKHDGNARAAQAEFQQTFANQLEANQKLPGLKWFRTTHKKFLLHHTIADLVRLQSKSLF